MWLKFLEYLLFPEDIPTLQEFIATAFFPHLLRRLLESPYLQWLLSRRR